MGTREVVENVYRHFTAGRIEDAFAACAPDFRFSWIADPCLVSHTADGVGKDGLIDGSGCCGPNTTTTTCALDP